jgi:hypothetical protein
MVTKRLFKFTDSPTAVQLGSSGRRNDLRLTGIRKDRRTMKVGYLGWGVGLASVVLLVALGSASAADQWVVLGEKTIKSTDPSTEIKVEGGKLLKEDIKKTKISVEGADVQLTKVVLHWNNRKDDTITNVGVVKSGGQTAPKDAPQREAALTSVAVQYKILNNAKTATIKVWGLD